MLLLGTFLSPAWAQAPIDDLEAKAKAGDVAAQSELALRYRTGQGVAKNTARALGLYRLAAKQGHASAYYNIATLYYNGDGVDPDDVAACRWFNIAADAGDAAAKEAVQRTDRDLSPFHLTRCRMSVGDAYLLGGDIKVDYPRAMQYFRKLAEAGNPEAYQRIAVMYKVGLGVPKDPAESTRWLLRSAEKGHTKSYLLLAEAYDKGLGIPSDPKLALKYYERAANAGLIRGMMETGRMYAEGRGTGVDKRKAYMWYMIALMYAEPSALSFAEALGAQLSEEERQDGERRALHFRPEDIGIDR